MQNLVGRKLQGRNAGWKMEGPQTLLIDRLVPWESFRADIGAVVLTPDEVRKSSAGRKPLDAIGLFRMLVLQALNNLSGSRRSIRCVISCQSRAH